MLVVPLNAFPWVANGLIEAWISLKRVEKLLDLPDLVIYDYYTKSTNGPIEITDGSFQWGDTFSLKDINFSAREGQLIGIIGQVGCGKTSLLLSILAEIDQTSGCVAVSDVDEGFGYVSQSPWLQRGTLQENILFGQPFVRHRYWAVLDSCALLEDIETLPGKDNTVISDSGASLSGGQKARIALARAVYQDKEIYLLDDILSAVDPHVARHIFTECICGVLQNKTRLLFTHQSRFLINAHHIIVIKDGKIINQGRPLEILPNYAEYLADAEFEMAESPNSTIDANSIVKGPSQESLVDQEEQQQGSLEWSTYGLYFKAVGICICPLVLISILLMQASRNIMDFWLALWVSDMNSTIPEKFITDERTPLFNDTTKYLIVYSSLAGLNSIFTLFRAVLFAYGGLSAAKVIHKNLLKKVMKAKLIFFETNPIGRVQNRFSSDIYTIDDSLPFILNILLAILFYAIGCIGTTIFSLPWMCVIIAPLIPFYQYLQSNYRLASRELKRLTSTTMSPLYSHFTETVNGAVTIRAFRSSKRFIRANDAWLESNQKAQLSSAAAAQWLGLRLQLIGVVMISGVGFVATVQHHLDFIEPGLIGLAISYALTMTSTIGALVHTFANTEQEMICVERVGQYLKGTYKGLEGEEDVSAIVTPFAWPAQGVITFHNVFFRYRDNFPYTLKDVSFATRPGERVGIVGRTGAGKSSLLKALFRLNDVTRGQIAIDSMNIKLLSLTQLRSHMSIIPQDPFIFEDTVRINLDPFLRHSDDELWTALTKSHISTVVQSLGGLDVEITKESFSVGQSQLLCLARTILKNAKIVCIDEATANVDEETDRLIQQTIRSSFTNSTVITIAHRVRTIIDCDRVLVLSDGQIVEFDSPTALLNNPDSYFYKLVNENKPSV